MARRAYQSSRYQAAKRRLIEEPTMCWHCGFRLATTIDHGTPVVLGGDDSPENLLPSCARCNFSRGGRLSGALRRARRQERRTLLRPWPDL
jgi:5-methylcytosine-specific restriction endonuclease McrA